MGTITPIQTHFKGYRFRSRLEARWAVFFESAGLRWFYEAQGFSVNGKPYLPDFYLPDYGYFEVRGKYEYDDDLMQSFADLIKEPLFIAFEEIPDPDSLNGYLKSFIPRSYARNSVTYSGFNDMFLQCEDCGKITIQNESYCTLKGNCCEGSRAMSLTSALDKARSARFEHGEIPRT